METKRRRIRAGVVGTGRLGREHARIYASLDSVERVLVYDRESARAEAVAREHGAEPCASIDVLLAGCDAVSVCTPATDHHAAAPPRRASRHRRSSARRASTAARMKW